ncbi:MAG: hypothetical protein JWP74_1926 [Marmoricola sp.]|nr:hypothetical protein [Marmoricola sp.]
MSRTRILAVLAALLAVALSVTVLSGSSEAASTRMAKKPVKPKVGQCRTTTFAQGFGYSDTRKPVSCSKAHTMRTFAVVTIPKKVNLKHLNAKQIGETALEICSPRFSKALGSSYTTRDQTSYEWSFFIPTAKQRKAGARWMRCDVNLLATPPGGSAELATLPNLPFPMIGSRPITDAIRRCLSDATHTYLTICSRAHAARSDQTFKMAGSSYPSAKAFTNAADSACPGKRFTAPYSYDWTLGDRTVVCYTATTS